MVTFCYSYSNVLCDFGITGLLKCVVRFWHNWIVDGCALKRQFTTNMESTELF